MAKYNDNLLYQYNDSNFVSANLKHYKPTKILVSEFYIHKEWLAHASTFRIISSET